PNGDRGRVWNAFQRGSNAIGTVAVGSGIGLSVVRDIVTAHGGSVSIADAPGRGGRFIVELPSASGSNQSLAPNSSGPMERVS
ncbi:MAG TPA: ATP-binding protein, partial [Gemmatimonadaceae bacterium]|nr:ATP-binding protein [Gemmatimonadaceae bacterium]